MKDLQIYSNILLDSSGIQLELVGDMKDLKVEGGSSHLNITEVTKSTQASAEHISIADINS